MEAWTFKAEKCRLQVPYGNDCGIHMMANIQCHMKGLGFSSKVDADGRRAELMNRINFGKFSKIFILFPKSFYYNILSEITPTKRIKRAAIDESIDGPDKKRNCNS